MSHTAPWYYVYLDTSTPSRWRWTLFAANNRKLANSGEGYNNYADCIAAINIVANTAGAVIEHSPTAAARLNRLARLRRPAPRLPSGRR